METKYLKEAVPLLVLVALLFSPFSLLQAVEEPAGKAPAGKDRGIGYVSTVAIAQKTLDLNIRDRSFSPTFSTLSLALTGTRGRYYLTLDHEFSIKDPIETGSGGLIFFSRTDTNLTFGYALTETFNIFTGIRSGETDAKFSANNNAFGNSSEGFYVGTSASYYIKGKGSLGASFAIASLDGNIALTEPFVDTSTFLATPPAEISGSALGFSLGISWSGQYSEDSIYTVGYKLQRYEFEDDTVFGGLDLTYEENFNSISVGLTHFF